MLRALTIFNLFYGIASFSIAYATRQGFLCGAMVLMILAFNYFTLKLLEGHCVIPKRPFMLLAVSCVLAALFMLLVNILRLRELARTFNGG